MEEHSIKKVGNRFHNDVKKFREVEIELRNPVELGHMAKQRGIFNRADSSLDSQVLKLLDCVLPKEDAVCCSKWNEKAELSPKQVEYAAMDVYATRSVYLTLEAMPWIDPFETPTPTRGELQKGVHVLVYAKNCSQLVARGQVSTETPNDAFDQMRERQMVQIRIRQSDMIAPIAKTCVTTSGATIGELFDSEGQLDEIETPWKRDAIRIMPKEPQGATENSNASTGAPNASRKPIDIRTKFVTVNVASAAMDAAHADMTDEEKCAAEAERIKNDIVHIFFRFKNALSSRHGCFRAFMARLSDAFFVPSHDDIEFIKEVLKANGYTEKEIKSKPWEFFKTSIRHTVPGPSILEAYLQRVFDLFADEVDQKSGKKFFGDKDSRARKLAKNVLEHVRKGCLSDVPGMTYYVQTGEDSMGILQYKCFRGTSGLEGFHQKIRQLIRGFAISPRFAIALLFEFAHRWNHDIDCKILLLSDMYKHFYDGFAIEEEMEFTRTWSLGK